MARKTREPYVPSTPIGFRWVDWLKDYPVGAQRQSGGEDLARRGQVSGMTFGAGTVEADVRGWGGEEYRVVLHFSPEEGGKWQAVRAKLAARPERMKAFSKGWIGPEIEETFASEGLELLPERYKHVKTVCTCADWMRPCEHALAALRMLGEEIERNVTVLTRLRGDGDPVGAVALEVAEEDDDVEPMRAEEFYEAPGDVAELRARLLKKGTARRLLKRLGPIEVYGVKTDLEILFKPVYDSVEGEARTMLEPERKEEP